MSVCKCVLCAAITVSSAAAMAQASTQPANSKPAEAAPSTRQNLSDRAATKAGKQAADPAMATRDWAAIDKNKDNLISPDEMEAYLKANPGPLAKPR